MTPLRHETVNGYLIQEYYWAGDLVVYVNHTRHFFNYETAVKLFASAKPHEASVEKVTP